MYDKITLKKYLEMIGDSTPTPGGGSVSAYAGAMASALGMMTTGIGLRKARIKGGKEKYSPNAKKLLGQAKKKFQTNYRKLLGLAEKDSQAYEIVCETYKIPHYELGRRKKINLALQRAAEIPYQVMCLCQENIIEIFRIRNLLPSQVLSDISVAVLLTKAAYHGARLNVVVNVQSIKDENLTKCIEKNIESLEKTFSYVLSSIEDWL